MEHKSRETLHSNYLDERSENACEVYNGASESAALRQGMHKSLAVYVRLRISDGIVHRSVRFVPSNNAWQFVYSSYEKLSIAESS